MHDLVNSISNINFLILDEVFEGLDPDNIEVIFDLIRLKSDAGKLVFVVTHSQLIDSLGSKSIYVDVDMDNMVSSIS
jgi:ABC-type multidrug transport system ATPase subunit